MTDIKFCRSCGTAVSPTARFCRECGTAVTQEPSIDTSTPIASTETIVAPSAKELVNEGVTLYQQGDYEAALGKFETASEADPVLAAAWSDKGCALGRLGKVDAALEAFNKALEVKPGDSKAREGKALCLRMLGASGES